MTARHFITFELSNDLNYYFIGAEYINMTTACQEAFVIACLYEVVEGRISARDASTIINRERVEADVEKLQKHIDTQRKAMRGSESLRKFIKRERTTMFERWGIADGSGLLVGAIILVDSLYRLLRRHQDKGETMLMLVVPFVGMRLAVRVLVLLKEDLMMSWPIWRRCRNSKSSSPAVVWESRLLHSGDYFR